MPKGKHINWSEWDHLLGTRPDKELASLVGCTTHGVINRRLRLGIEPAVNSSWTLEDKQLLQEGKQKCKDCLSIKPINEFVKHQTRSDRMGRQCVECNRKWQRDCRINNKKYYIGKCGGRCQNCGFFDFVSSLQFHHVQMPKLFEPSKAMCSGMSESDVLKELDKCCLLCSNCHDAYHGGELELKFKKRDGIGWTVRSSGDALDSQNCPTEDKGTAFECLGAINGLQ